MTRLTFQFLPTSYVNTQEICLKECAAPESSITTYSSGQTAIELSESRIEFDPSGNIRFTTVVDDASKKSIEQTYQRATQTIDDLLSKSEQSYRVSLILGDMDSIEQYLDHEDDVYEFGAHRFDTTEVAYTELGDDSVKISFTPDGKAAVV